MYFSYFSIFYLFYYCSCKKIINFLKHLLFSHEYVIRKACELLDRTVADTNIISCHLGAGCSVTATKGHNFCHVFFWGRFVESGLLQKALFKNRWWKGWDSTTHTSWKTWWFIYSWKLFLSYSAVFFFKFLKMFI